MRGLPCRRLARPGAAPVTHFASPKCTARAASKPSCCAPFTILKLVVALGLLVLCASQAVSRVVLDGNGSLPAIFRAATRRGGGRHHHHHEGNDAATKRMLKVILSDATRGGQAFSDVVGGDVCEPCSNASLSQLRPRAFIIGAQKGGTTALMSYLAAHPAIASPLNEPHVLNTKHDREARERGVQTIPQCALFDLYRRWYDEQGVLPQVRDGGLMYIDKDPKNLIHSDVVPRRLLCADANAKVVVVLRNPVDRAYSAFNMNMQRLEEGRDVWTALVPRALAAPLVRLGRALGIVPNFERAASEEREIMRASGILDALASPAEEARAFARLGEEGGWYGRNGYLIRGLYHVQLVQWLAAFRDHFGPKEVMNHILIMESEANRRDKQGSYDRVLTFLDLPPHDLGDGGGSVDALNIVAPDTAHNAENSRVYEHAMSAATRRDLEAFFRPHNARLHELLSPLGVEISWAKQAYLELREQGAR